MELNKVTSSEIAISQALERYWHTQASKNIAWIKKWSKVLTGSFTTHDVKWFVDGKLNACYNCVDRHLPHSADKIAIIWEGNNPNQNKKLTYKELHSAVSKFANLLKSLDVKKGDKICIYLPQIPEAIIAMLACARIGAIHSVVFAGFSAEALKSRIIDTEAKLLITADGAIRGEKLVSLKENSELAVQDCQNIKNVIVVKYIHNKIKWNEKIDIDYHSTLKNMD